MALPEHKFAEELIQTAKAIGAEGKGILAADESDGTIKKRFDNIKVESTPENRATYRGSLFKADGIENHISGVILFEETLFQKDADGTPLVDILKAKNIIPGIKVDKGARKLPFSNDTFTQGLTDLDLRCKKYYEAGARFAKWRAVLKIVDNHISPQSINETAHTLARYAATCQDNGLAPIVEPEILMDGDHSLATCQYWTEKTLAACYKALNEQNVLLEGTLLKPNMVLAGQSNKDTYTNEQNAKATVTALLRTVPAAVPTICFLSGGQSEEEATLNLNAVNHYARNVVKNKPWSLTFSFGRALQKSALEAWVKTDKPESLDLTSAQQIKQLQATLIVRAKSNGDAQKGVYAGTSGGSTESTHVANYVY